PGKPLPISESGWQVASEILFGAALHDRGTSLRGKKILYAPGRRPSLPMSVERRAAIEQSLPEERLCIARGADRRMTEIGIESREQPRTGVRCGLSCPEPTNLRLFEQIVAAEDFVGALARQHDLKALIANM